MHAARLPASDDASPDVEDIEEEEDDTTVLPLVDLTESSEMNEEDESEKFMKMAEDMANAIDAENGPEEFTQPWLGEPEEWVHRTPEVSDTEAA